MKLIRAHNGLRGIAALLVVAYHLQYRTGHFRFEDASTFFARSYLMVDLFFILSGFIMAYVHDVRPDHHMNSREVKNFFQRRFVRIYPLHFLILIALVIFAGATHAYTLLRGTASPVDWSPRSLILLASQFLLLNAWVPPPNGWNIPSWSISAEFVAYALFPLLVLAFAVRPRLSTAIAIMAIGGFYTLWIGQSLDITGGIGAPLRCFAGFTLGFVVHAQRGAFTTRSDQTAGIAQAAAIGWIAATMMIPTADALVVPGFALLIALTWTDQGIFAKALGKRGLQYLGDISFAVYISHLLILDVLSFCWDRTARHLVHDPVIERMSYIATAYVLVIAVSALLHRRFEKPVRAALMGRWIDKPRHMRGADQPARAPVPPSP